jgi:uncharacterized phage protein (TIGR02220 family)
MRKTYGWNKAEDDIARSQIIDATGLLNPHVTTALQELQAANVLVITQGKHAKHYKINKHYNEWRVTNLVTITETVTITKAVNEDCQNGNNSLPKQYPQKTTPKDNTKDICLEVLNYLNAKANRNYKPVKSNLDFVKARLSEGYTIEDVFHVINVKVSQWLNNVEMNQYLRPATLFNATKFSQYVAESEAASKSNETPDWAKGML